MSFRPVVNQRGTGSSTGWPGGNPAFVWMGLGALFAALAALYLDGLGFMVTEWTRPEYSYGYLVPPIALFMGWQGLTEIEEAEAGKRWLGVLLIALALVLGTAGIFATVYTIIQYSFLLLISGISITLLGPRGTRYLVPALLFLIFMIPLPTFLYNQLSSQLQLISSELGVALVRLAGIAVNLEGNVIDLGTFQLQVIEACSGLRYLFPLMTFGFLFAWLFRGPTWQKIVLVLSTVPIAVLMNCMRIGAIGILVEYQGIGAAEGFLHYFEGWIVFMLCVALLFAEVWAFAKVAGRPLAFRAAFGLGGSRGKALALARNGLSGAPFIVGASLVLAVAAAALFFQQRPELEPEPRPLALFPMQIGTWTGRTDALMPGVVAGLQLDDYLLADYGSQSWPAPVNLYIAYYGSQRSGVASHSPRSCIPGGGWHMGAIEDRRLPGVGSPGAPLVFNRVVISREGQKQLVYYWFEQRGRVLTSEYLVKWYIFWDAMTRNRTDGALVRVVTPVVRHEAEADADHRLADFLKQAYPKIRAALPD